MVTGRLFHNDGPATEKEGRERARKGPNEAWTARVKEGREEVGGGGIEREREGAREQGSKGGRETSREVVYSQTNHSQTGPCP